MDIKLKQINVARGDMPIEWFDESPAPLIPDNGLFKVHNDGGHFVGTLVEQKPYFPPLPKSARKARLNDILDDYIDAEVKQNYKGAVLQNRVVQQVEREHPEIKHASEAVKTRIKEKYHNVHNRKKRFKRKADLNKWNYFVSITYSDDKMNETTFRKKLKNCLRNMSQNHHWRYMGVFERGEDNDRLHFHALMYIPQGEMVGEIYERRDYSTKKHEMQVTHCNTHFEKKFGRNDFDEVDDVAIRFGRAKDYLLKYVTKQGERIVYSRGIKDHIFMQLENKDIACGMLNTANSFVLFDGKVDWEKDVMKYKEKQASLFDDDTQ